MIRPRKAKFSFSLDTLNSQFIQQHTIQLKIGLFSCLSAMGIVNTKLLTQYTISPFVDVMKDLKQTQTKDFDFLRQLNNWRSHIHRTTPSTQTLARVTFLRHNGFPQLVQPRPNCDEWAKLDKESFRGVSTLKCTWSVHDSLCDQSKTDSIFTSMARRKVCEPHLCIHLLV